MPKLSMNSHDTGGYRDHLPDKRRIDAFGLLQRAQFGPKQRLALRLGVHLLASTKSPRVDDEEVSTILSSIEQTKKKTLAMSTGCCFFLPTLTRFRPPFYSPFPFQKDDGSWSPGLSLGLFEPRLGPFSIDGLSFEKSPGRSSRQRVFLSFFCCRTSLESLRSRIFPVGERERDKEKGKENGRESEVGDVARRGSYSRLCFHACPPQAPFQVSGTLPQPSLFSAEFPEENLSFSYIILYRA